MVMSDITTYFRLIQSTQNDLIKKIRVHLDGGTRASQLRKDSGLACIEGIHLVDTWIKSSRISEIKTIITSYVDLQKPEISNMFQSLIDHCEKHHHELPELILVDEVIQSSLSGLVNGPCLLGLVTISLPHSKLEAQVDTIVLDAIQDSGNVGTILRTALGAGYQRVICTVGTASIWSLKVLRAAMGAHLHLEIFEMVDPQEFLQTSSQAIYVTALDSAAIRLYDLGPDLLQPHTFVFGNEGQGVSPLFLDHGTPVMIPQENHVESLNVSAAAAVCLFETRRIRHNAN
jgi:TrmH family RNA methyltransferase